MILKTQNDIYSAILVAITANVALVIVFAAAVGA